MSEKEDRKDVGDVISDVFNQAKDGLMAFGETIASKSRDVYDETKLNMQRSRLENDNERHFEALGKLIYEKLSYPDEAVEIIQKIDENKKEIEELRMKTSRKYSERDGSAETPAEDSVAETKVEYTATPHKTVEKTEEKMADGSEYTAKSVTIENPDGSVTTKETIGEKKY